MGVHAFNQLFINTFCGLLVDADVMSPVYLFGEPYTRP